MLSHRIFVAGVSLIVLGISAADLVVAAQSETGWAVRIVFGTDDKEPTDWSGKIVGPADLLDRIELETWRFATGQGDAIQPNQRSWKVQTRLGIAPLERLPVQVPGQQASPAKQIPWPVGVTVIGRGPEPDRLAVETAQGNFEINVRNLRWGVATKPAAGVRSERKVPPLAVGNRTDKENVHDDFPTLLGMRNGDLRLAWISFGGKDDRILAANWESGGWTAPSQISPFGRPRNPAEPEFSGDHGTVTLAEDQTNSPWAIWSEQIRGRWGIRALRQGREAHTIRSITNFEEGPKIHPASASCSDGSLVVAWQGFREGQSDIFLSRYFWEFAGSETQAKESGRTLQVSSSPTNDWMPAVAVDSTGLIHLAWDSYDAGDYDLVHRSVRVVDGNLDPSPVRKLASTPLAEMNASIACDTRGRVWVAYDEGTAAWGKDYGFWAWFEKWPQGTRLYEQRRFRVQVLDGERLMEPTDPFASLPTEFQEFSEQPIVRIDRHDRPWVFFRHRTAKNPREDGWAAGGWWELFAIYLDGERWSDPIPFPRSMGRQSQPSSVAATKDGFAVAWGTDGRTFAQPADGIQSRIHTGFIDVDRAMAVGANPQPPVLKPYSPSDLSGLVVKNVHADESGDLKRIRDYSITAAGKTLKIYRGDLHRHTEISGDGVGDGSLTDLYRYALDAASMDYIMVTDHGMGADRDYPWWRTQKSNDMYYVAGRFVPMYGYERSIKYPWGHRNVIWTERGHKTFPTTKAQSEPVKKKAGGGAQPADDDTEQLYDNLRKTGGIATLHTSASDQGTNWETGFDPQLEPFVEIFQGYHTSYEGFGTPLAIDDKTAIVHGPYRPAGFVWNALEKGYRLGFQASSDHIATHNSYACVWAESLDRRSLVAGMKARHSYAATDNIILDVRSGDHIMGDEFAADGPIALDVKIFGTAPLARVEIIRNKEVVYSHDAKDSARAEFRWTDMQSRRAGSTNYYYVRVQQTDRQMAWASPMWVKRD